MIINNKLAEKIRSDFPIFNRKIRNKRIIYLDNAATTQKPNRVIKAVEKFYSYFNSNIHRGVYRLSNEATDMYDSARRTVAEYIGANFKEVIFTKSTTESINIIAHSINTLLKDKDEIVITAMEHHSNLIPWQQFAKRHSMKLKIVKLKKNMELDYKDFKEKITSKTGVVAFVHISNSFGVINDAIKIIKLAKQKGALTVLDSAQSAGHTNIDVKKLDCDFLAFSGHKMYAPTGIGVLYGREELLNKMNPLFFGGDMISEVSYTDAKWNELPMKFEAGTPNIAGAIGLGEAIKFIENIGIKNIELWENKLLKYSFKKLKEIKNIKVYPSQNINRSGIISFTLKGIHSHDIASILDDYAICIRAGHHCAIPLMKSVGLSGTARISFAVYNTFEDINILIKALKKAIEIFGEK